MKFLILLPMVLLCATAWLEAPAACEPWLDPSWSAPFGTDELGRDVLRVLLASAGRSTLTGTLWAATTLALATWAASLTLLPGFHLGARLIRMAAQVVESVPLFLWVLSAFAAYRTHSPLVVPLAFVLAVLPFALTVIQGEFTRLAEAPFIEAAHLAGLNTPRLILAHYLPNAVPVLGPLAIQLLGIAISIRGAIGVLGFSTRADLDLGIILLRGKENITEHPTLMTTALLAITLLYVYLDSLSRWVSAARKEDEAPKQPARGARSPAR